MSTDPRHWLSLHQCIPRYPNVFLRNVPKGEMGANRWARILDFNACLQSAEAQSFSRCSMDSSKRKGSGGRGGRTDNSSKKYFAVLVDKIFCPDETMGSLHGLPFFKVTENLRIKIMHYFQVFNGFTK